MSDKKAKPKALGRGLAALIPSGSPAPAAESPGKTSSQKADPSPQAVPAGPVGDTVRRIPIEEISPMPGQPRMVIAPVELNELAESIRENGILQPILVRSSDEGYQLIAGERRWQASQRAGLETIPALVKDVDERTAYQLALIENIQREDLNPLEVAYAFRRLVEDYAMTQQEVAQQVGKDRATVANYLRILNLPKQIRDAVERGHLSFGHARTLAGLDRQLIARLDTHKLIGGRISVRELERLAKRLKEGGGPSLTKPDNDRRRGETTQVRHVRRQLERHLGLRVNLRDKNGKGRLEIEYNSLDELDGLLQLLGVGEG